MRRNLAPLQRVAHTATQVSNLKLDSGAVALAGRIPVPTPTPAPRWVRSASPSTDMLDNVEGALQSRHESEQRVRQFVADASHAEDRRT